MSHGVVEIHCEAEVNNVDYIPMANADQEVVQFDVAMNKASRVDIFDTRNLIMNE